MILDDFSGQKHENVKWHPRAEAASKQRKVESPTKNHVFQQIQSNLAVQLQDALDGDSDKQKSSHAGEKTIRH